MLQNARELSGPSGLGLIFKHTIHLICNKLLEYLIYETKLPFTRIFPSHEDHPLGVLDKDFNRVSKGTVTTVAMKQSTVSLFVNIV